jgi:hypothetical protein
MLTSFKSKPDVSFLNLLKKTHEIWNDYLPFMILIGVCYIFWGLFFKKIKKYRFEINLILSILSLIWVFAYAIRCIECFNNYLSVFKFQYIVYIFGGLGCLVAIAFFTIPQYIIGKIIKNLN